MNSSAATARITNPRTALAEFISERRRLFVLAGAGCSTGSGIPDYRDADGSWKRRPPVTYQAFTGDPTTRARYWARSMIGWPVFSAARPNSAHQALARLETAGHFGLLVTQNVDRLHHAAGSERVVELHGRLDEIICLTCAARSRRSEFQLRLTRLNPDWQLLQAATAPDGDADLEGHDFTGFVVPDCQVCGGMLKPDVVFFGENVPRDRVEQAYSALAEADGMLIVGSSLMVYSGYRFAVAAHERGLPIAAINLGKTRADSLLSLKVSEPIADALDFVVSQTC